jgi:hypothetical protein
MRSATQPTTKQPRWRQQAAALSVFAAVRGLLAAGFQNKLALRGGVAIGDLDEVGFSPDTINAASWTARFEGLIGEALVSAYRLESECDWSGAVVSDELAAWLQSIVMLEHGDQDLSLLENCVLTGLLFLTRAPIKEREPAGKTTVRHERRWAINWPFLQMHFEWNLRPDQVVEAFSSFGRAVDETTQAKRDETLAFMERAEEESAVTRTRLSSAS